MNVNEEAQPADELPEPVSATAAVYASPTAGGEAVVSRIRLGKVGDWRFHEAVGQVAIAHGQMDYMLRVIIKSLSGRALRDVLDDTERTPTSQLRSAVEALGESRSGGGHELNDLKTFLGRARELSDRRHRLMHDVCALNDEGEPVVLLHTRTQVPLYPTEEVRKLADELRASTIELDNWRIAMGDVNGKRSATRNGG